MCDQPSSRPITAKPKYGAISGLALSHPNLNNCRVATRPKPSSEIWDNDFVTDDSDCIKIPTRVRSSSDLINIDTRNFRLLSKKKTELKEIVEKVRNKTNASPSKATGKVAEEFSTDIKEAEALVSHLESSHLGPRRNNSNNSDAETQDQKEIFMTIISRTRPPSPVTSDGSSASSDFSETGSIPFYTDNLPPLIEFIEGLIVKLQRYLSYLNGSNP